MLNPILIALGLALQSSTLSVARSVGAPLQYQAAAAPAAAQLAERYAKVGGELQRTAPTGLTAIQSAHRQLVIELLAGYGQGLDFPHLGGATGERLPVFRDGDGRLCALAHLLDRTGQGPLVERLAQANNGGWLVEFQSDPALLDWMQRHGLSLAEVARIQGPGFGGNPVAPPPPPIPGDTVIAIGEALGGDAAPAGAGSGGPATGGPAGPVVGGGAAGPTTGGASGPAAPGGGGPSTGGALAADWTVWWELNKLDFLVAKRPAIGGAEEGTTTADAGRYRPRALALAAKGIDGDHAAVRAAAAVLGGRLGLHPDRLKDAFDDASGAVRHGALLGLGLSPRPDALRLLAEILKDQTRAERISPLARYYASLGLGLARLQGAPEDLETLIGNEARSLQSTQDRLGALGFAQLVPSAGLRVQALAWLEDLKVSQAVRCRAAESLRAFGDAETLRALQDALGDRQLEVRRSAALALGHVPEPLALQALQTAADLEAEQLTRGYLLLSIGRRGGPEAGRFLREILARESGMVRPFAALALGLQARQDSDAESRTALRKLLAGARGADVTQATALALGLAIDGQAVELLTGLLEASGSEQERHFAALALGLIGGEPAKAALRRQLAREKAPFAELAAAQALGLQGDPADAPLLLATLAEAPNVELRLQYAAALGLHGSNEAIEGLLNLCEGGQLPPAAEAAALEALGVLLEDGQHYSIGRLARSINPGAMPDWQNTLWNFLL
jgi:HEAT repeat protein